MCEDNTHTHTQGKFGVKFKLTIFNFCKRKMNIKLNKLYYISPSISIHFYFLIYYSLITIIIAISVNVSIKFIKYYFFK